MKGSVLGLTCGLVLSSFVWADCSPGIQLTKPDDIYDDHFDGTVTDSETGLMWAKCYEGKQWAGNSDADSSDDACSGPNITFTWDEAFDRVEEANTENYLGYSDWRLPNYKELASLIEVACDFPAINENLFPDSSLAGLHWTSTVYSSGQLAWRVNFALGTSDYYTKASKLRIRLVRTSF